MSIPDPFSSHPNIKEEKAVWLARLCIIGTNIWTIFNINHKQCVYIPFSEDFNMVSTSAVNIALIFSLGLVASPCENATIASS